MASLLNFLSNGQPLPFHGRSFYAHQIVRQNDSTQHLIDQLLASMSNATKQQSKEKKQVRKQFYEYNLNWANKVKNKTERLKQQMQQKEKAQIEKSERQTTISNFLNSLRACDHQGPIKGWHRNVQNYFQKKNKIPEMPKFKPKINDITDSILSRVSRKQKIEDRLIQIGRKFNENKIKIRQQILSQQAESTTKKQVHPALFQKLFNQGRKRIIQREKSMLALSQGMTFKPRLNQLNPDMQRKVAQRRQRRTQPDQSMTNSIPEKKLTRSQLRAFLDRNYPQKLPNFQNLSYIDKQSQVSLFKEFKEPLQGLEVSNKGVGSVEMSTPYQGSMLVVDSLPSSWQNESWFSQDSLQYRIDDIDKRIQQIQKIAKEDI